MMRYGVDIHGTLAIKRPDGTLAPSPMYPLLKGLMKAWVEKGDKVYVLSGPVQSQIDWELRSLGLIRGVHYHEALSITDNVRRFFPEAPLWEDPDKPGHFWTDDSVWNSIKGLLARERGIDVVIDDQAEYQDAMPDSTEFILVR